MLKYSASWVAAEREAEGLLMSSWLPAEGRLGPQRLRQQSILEKVRMLQCWGASRTLWKGLQRDKHMLKMVTHPHHQREKSLPLAAPSLQLLGNFYFWLMNSRHLGSTEHIFHPFLKAVSSWEPLAEH